MISEYIKWIIHEQWNFIKFYRCHLVEIRGLELKFHQFSHRCALWAKSEACQKSVSRACRTVDVKTHEWTDRRTDGRCRWWQTRGGTEEDEVGGNPTPSRSVGNVRAPLPTSVPLSTTSTANRLAALPWTHPRIHRSARRDKSPFLRRASTRLRGKERVSYDTEEDSIMFARWAASRRVALCCVASARRSALFANYSLRSR